MPSSDGSSPAMSEEEMASSVISRFISIPEQTYEEFLSSFTGLPRGTDKPHSPVTLDGPQMQKIQTTQQTQDAVDVTNQQEEPEQLTICEGTTVGTGHSLTYPGRVQVDNYFNSSDIDPDSDNDETSPSVLLFPGESDLELAGGNKPIVRSTCLQIHTSSGVESTAEKHLSDTIQAFSLDPSFDYDRGVLTSKLSEKEINFLRLRGLQKVKEIARKT
ncbi:intraflagellar transport-associated protein [Eleutherodactylus coqui]|uniref:intraflagellar transport-associated protein n=1 Tax=Eleutherodactylus coqui TaxID=57060 RepID=UPI003461C00A